MSDHPDLEGLEALGEFRVVMSIPVYEAIEPAKSQALLEEGLRERFDPAFIDITFAMLMPRSRA
jgi:hypothetical protein